jgi:hypothetical protein
MSDLLGRLDQIQAGEEASPDKLREFEAVYRAMPREERPAFFQALLSRLETRKGAIEGDMRRLAAASDQDAIAWSRLLTELRRKIESPRMRAFRRFINLSGGLKFLLDFRADVLAAQRQASVNLEPLDEEIAHLFNSWFQHGFLYLQEITQDSSYRQIRFLKDHDMVHPMTNLEEMGDRMGRDRRCFALYHRAMPEEPVVFIEVALTKDIARSIHQIIGGMEAAPVKKGAPDTAIFYSINNTQNGLAGLGLGKVLIFQVVDALKKGNPEVTTFSTLSPIPGFWDRYLKRILKGGESPYSLKAERLEGFFSKKGRQAILARRRELSGKQEEPFPQALLEILSDPQWIEDPVYGKLLEKPLTEITFFYIAQEKDAQGRPLNPVANFHMGNGATVGMGNINFGANRFRRGMEESCGMMVNYVYSQTWLKQIGRTMQSLLPWKAR